MDGAAREIALSRAVNEARRFPPKPLDMFARHRFRDSGPDRLGPSIEQG